MWATRKVEREQRKKNVRRGGNAEEKRGVEV